MNKNDLTRMFKEIKKVQTLRYKKQYLFELMGEIENIYNNLNASPLKIELLKLNIEIKDYMLGFYN